MSAAEPPQERPLDPEALLAPLAGRKGLVLAVSGGPDSTALMLLAARWAGRPPLLVVSVDHGLRPESADEVRVVAANAERLGIACRIVRPDAPPLRGNRQAAARAARYRCLAAAAHEAGCDTIVTAHHQDDQAETLLIRLARGSGVYGLAAMAPEVEVEGLRLARPLLGVPGAALKRLAEASGLPLVHDPSNEDRRYDRVRIRALMPALAAEGLTPERLAETAERLRSAAEALEVVASALLAEHVAVDALGVARGRVARFLEAHPEIGLRALARLLQAVGGTEYTPRFDRLQSLHASLAEAAGGARPARRTFNNVLLTVACGRFTAEREWGRGLPHRPLLAGEVVVWDGRFRVEAPEEPGLEVGPLAEAGHALSSGQAGLMALPAIYRGDRLAAVPDIAGLPSFVDAVASFEARCLVAERLAEPRMLSGLPPPEPRP
ncbi:MAG TPA: tRNA lysidine(34) synthetase TilS [Afifellaceae bacterium]|nr:tRNA lysidine(34) synthetase TilS [Afifellaceae bacterium]